MLSWSRLRGRFSCLNAKEWQDESNGPLVCTYKLKKVGFENVISNHNRDP